MLTTLPQPPARTTTPLMTHLAFLRRLTATEFGKFEQLLAASVDARFEKAKFDAAREIDVSDPDLIGFVTGLSAANVLDAPVADRIAALLAEKPLTERGAICPDTGKVTA